MRAGGVCAACAASFAIASTPASAAAAEVMAFLPHWELGAEIRWDVVDVVAYFDVDVGPDGRLGDASGFPDHPDVQDLLAGAEREGSRVVLTVTNFDNDEISALLGSDEARARFIDEAIDLVVGGGGHGINIDLEFVPGEDRDAFTSFVGEVAAAFRDAGAEHHISVSVPALNHGDAYDVAGLVEVADAVFIMGYDYHYRGGDPGPVAPLSVGALWPPADLELTAGIYTDPIDRTDRDRVILGLPLYGYDWPADSDQPLAETRGEAESVFYRDFDDIPGELRWDEAAKAPWRVYEDDGGYRQVWAENAESVAAKVDFALSEDLGVGFWALGYADADPEVWDAVAARTGDEPPSGEADAGPGPGPDARGARDAGGGPGGGEVAGGCRIGSAGGAAGAVFAASLIGLIRRDRRPASR